LDLSQDLTSVEEIWAALSSIKGVSLSSEVLSKVGLAFSVLWRYCWQKTLPEQSLWIVSDPLELLATAACTVDGNFAKKNRIVLLNKFVYFQYKKNLYPRKLTNTNIISLQR
jgi:hypothetical protein